MGRVAALMLALIALFWPLPAGADEPSVGRALLIGVDEFVSRPSAYPSSANNVLAMQEVFEAAQAETLLIPDGPVTTPEQLAGLIQAAFSQADGDDVSYLYMSTHGVYEPGEEPQLLLSDGETETGLTPAQLESAFANIRGTKVLILDACNSGAFIGKGGAVPPDTVHFLDGSFKVLTSSGAMEESWYWSSSGEAETHGPQGAFYFTQALSESLSARSGYPADRNRDGNITLTELYDYLLRSHAASTPQVYPQTDDFALFRYDPAAPQPTGMERAPVMDVTFSGATLSRDDPQISIEFIVTRPVRVAYQIVYQRDGRWEFDTAHLIYDQAERFTAFGDQAGAVSAGRKVRTVRLGKLQGESYGYVLVQLVTLDQGRLSVHAGRVLCVPPAGGDMNLTASVDAVLDASSGRELSIFIGHDFPCTLSVAIVDENEKVIHRICHRQSTRPMQIPGSVFYWDGRLKDGSMAPPGTYRVRAQANMNDTAVTVLSSAFSIR